MSARTDKARDTDRWTEILMKALTARVAKRWRFVSFRGVRGGEWRGIVDVIAIRKDTSAPSTTQLKRGDLFEIILIQMKGGSAKMPSCEDKRRLRAVAKHYHAKAIVLFEWQKGRKTKYSALDKRLEWKESSARAIFGEAKQ